MPNLNFLSLYPYGLHWKLHSHGHNNTCAFCYFGCVFLLKPFSFLAWPMRPRLKVETVFCLRHWTLVVVRSCFVQSSQSCRSHIFYAQTRLTLLPMVALACWTFVPFSPCGDPIRWHIIGSIYRSMMLVHQWPFRWNYAPCCVDGLLCLVSNTSSISIIWSNMRWTWCFGIIYLNFAFATVFCVCNVYFMFCAVLKYLLPPNRYCVLSFLLRNKKEKSVCPVGGRGPKVLCYDTLKPFIVLSTVRDPSEFNYRFPDIVSSHIPINNILCQRKY